MTASLLILVPVALLVVISGFCFVGCVFDSHGLGQSFTTYSALTSLPIRPASPTGRSATRRGKALRSMSSAKPSATRTTGRIKAS